MLVEAAWAAARSPEPMRALFLRVSARRGQHVDVPPVEERVADAPAAQSLDLFRLDGRTALVTGGGGALGTAMAVGLAQVGANVALVDRDGAAAERTASQLREAKWPAAQLVARDVQLGLVDEVGSVRVVTKASEPASVTAFAAGRCASSSTTRPRSRSTP